MIGETLSHFKILDKVGQGGMGIVYRALDLNLDRQVAIKILAPEAQRDEDSVGRFLREAKTASRLQHPAITTIYEFGVKDDLRYLVMEYIRGRTLREMLKEGPVPIRQALEIATQMADALTLADEKGIIHRDIKSENVMVTERGKVKILDFGLAKIKERSGGVGGDTFQTVDGQIIGTVSYMSPEQALGTDLDARTDIYSTGVVLFEMVTGALPFTGRSANIVLAKILNQPAPLASDYNAEVPPPLEKLIAKCLEKNREQRCPSAVRLLVDLQTVKQQIEGARDWVATGVVRPGRAPGPTLATADDRRDLLLPTAPGDALAGTAADALAAALPAAGQGPTVAVPAPDLAAVPQAPPQVAARREAVSPSERVWRLRAHFLVSVVRKVFSAVATLYCVGCLVMFPLPLFAPDVVAGMLAVQLLHLAIDPALILGVEVIGVSFIFGGLNFMLLGLALATYVLKNVVTGYLDDLESWIRKPLLVRLPVVASPAAAPQQMPPGSGMRRGSRMSLLRDYAAAKRILGEVKKEMAFLAADVAEATGLKLGEEKIVVDHAFGEYRKFAERIVREFRAYKVAWTPDGLMTCFSSVDDAVAAARKLLVELDGFNREGHRLRDPFRIRCGLNFGEVLLPDNRPLEQVSDEALDAAGHLQKQADADSLWISGEAYDRLLDRSGFIRLETQVDNHDVFAWRKPS